MADREECRNNAYVDYLEQQADLSLANIFYYAMCKLVKFDFSVKHFDKRKELIDMITELDFTGEFDTGFEDIRKEI